MPSERGVRQTPLLKVTRSPVLLGTGFSSLPARGRPAGRVLIQGGVSGRPDPIASLADEGRINTADGFGNNLSFLNTPFESGKWIVESGKLANSGEWRVESGARAGTDGMVWDGLGQF